MLSEKQREPESSSETDLCGVKPPEWALQAAFLARGGLRPGDLVLHRFEVIRFLGSGGMGEVYEVADRHLQGTHVALKALLAETAIPDSMIRFEREVLLARQITHPNVCPVYDIFRAEDTLGYLCFIAMKLLAGETLAARLHRQTRLTSEETICSLRQISSALVAAHRAKVLHRDLKPGNVMLNGSGPEVVAVVTDFGLAGQYEPELTLVSGGYILGTRGYIAPEVLAGQRGTPASDLYALGVMLHEILTGHKPVPHPKSGRATPTAELAKLGAPHLCVSLVEACLDPDADARYRGFEKAVRQLNPDSSRRPAIYPTAQSWSRRRLLAGSAAAAVTLAGFAWWEQDFLTNLFEPLPKKRYVALMTWPPDSNKEVRPVLAGVMDAIESELARAEAIDHDLFVISANDVTEGTSPARLTEVRDTLGANLVLATSGVLAGSRFQLLLRVLDASSNAVLRARNMTCALAEVAGLPARAVAAAAGLLGISLEGVERPRPAAFTDSAVAYKAFQEAEELRNQPNDAGLDAAIHKYVDATVADSHFSLAFAKLAFTYSHLFDVRRDGAALELARNSAERALELDRNSVDAHLALSAVYDSGGDHKKALEAISKALSLDPSNPQTLNLQAFLYARMNRWSDAEQTYRRINKQRPNFWPAYNDLGWVLAIQGKYEQSIGIYRQAILAAPRSVVAYNNIGEAYRRLGKYADAEASFRKGLELSQDGRTCANFSQCLRGERKYAEALVYARKAVALDPAVDQNWLELGDCYSVLRGEQRNAYEAYLRAATEVDRQLQSDSLDGSAWMRLALYRIKCNHHDVVLPLVEKAEKIGAADLDSQLAKARIFENLGRPQDGWQR